MSQSQHPESDDNNKYRKLEQANLIFLNPTLELVNQYTRTELHHHCYYHISKFLKGDHPLWAIIESHDYYQIEDFLSKKSSEIKDPKIKSNLKLAIQNQDQEYLDYLLSHRPKVKIQLKISSKVSLVPKELVKPLALEDKPNPLSHELKHALNQYILRNKLQKENMIKIDDVINKLMPKAPSDQYVDYREFHQYFRDQFQK
jgi:hypothetical protein